MSYIVKLPKGLYEWDFDHTGPEGLEIVYVDTDVTTKKAYVLYKSKKPNQK